MLHGVIMAGGSGTRFWPASRHACPKQFLRLSGTRTLIQSTLDRCAPWVPPERMWVVTNAAQADQTARQLPEIPREQILVEPCGRNTAACIGLAAHHLARHDSDATMLVLPADHVIGPPEQFRAGVETMLNLLSEDARRLVLFGVRPNYPATGFGYIEAGDPVAGVAGAYGVASFREKPTRPVAQQFLDSGRFLWNCGIFAWRAARILETLETYEPDLHGGLATLAEAIGSAAYVGRLNELFPGLKSISIDYAVLERAPGICVVEAPFRWDDVGSWAALPRLLGADDDGNTIDGLHLGVQTRGSIIRSTADHLVATMGVENLVVVHTPDATLIARRDDEESVKLLVDRLRAAGLDRFL